MGLRAHARAGPLQQRPIHLRCQLGQPSAIAGRAGGAQRGKVGKGARTAQFADFGQAIVVVAAFVGGFGLGPVGGVVAVEQRQRRAQRQRQRCLLALLPQRAQGVQTLLRLFLGHGLNVQHPVLPHHPALHDLGVDTTGQALQRVVLSDWDLAATPPRADLLRLDTQGQLQRVAIT